MGGYAIRLLSRASSTEEELLREKLRHLQYEILPPDCDPARAARRDIIEMLFVPDGQLGAEIRRQLRNRSGLRISIVADVPAELMEELLRVSDDFLFWPCAEEELGLRLARLSRLSATLGGEPPKAHLHDEYLMQHLVGRSEAFAAVVKLVRQVAQHDAPTVIEGETGTGKEVLARAIHYLGKRSGKPFVPVNCGSLPDTLIENELFGHKRGAYTDAKEDHLGMVEHADGGTLFLDEIEALSLKGQVTLLRFLQDMEFKPLGARHVKKVNVRVIAASNQPLIEMVEQGTFRRDLFFRLSVVPISVPPLRGRMGDIELLAEHFIEKFRKLYGEPDRQLPPETVQWMRGHHWPGNVRELENVVHRAFVMGRDALPGEEWTVGSVTLHVGGLKEAKAKVIEEFEANYLAKLLKQTAGNVSQAARLAGKERRAFGKLLQKYRIK